jgi:hypothetical protein
MLCKHTGGGDFGLAWMQAKELLAGRTPYPISPQILYPLPAAMFAIPFTFAPVFVAAGIFFGLSCGLLTFFICKEGPHKLLIFSSVPFLSSMIVAQWTPLMMVSVFIPILGAMALKPQIGLPCAIASRSWTAPISAILMGLASLVVRPTWPMEFLAQASGYPHFFPIIFFVGPALLAALPWWRDSDAQFLLLMASVPQRFLYDAFPLWLIPRTLREILFASFCSWCGLAYSIHLMPHETYQQLWTWSVLFNYVPMLIIVLARRMKSKMRPDIRRLLSLRTLLHSPRRWSKARPCLDRFRIAHPDRCRLLP